MAKSGNQLFRQKALDQMTSPDQLTDCLKVTNPGVWAVLIAVVLLLLGLLAWACVGTLKTTADAKVVVKDDSAAIMLESPYVINQGMTVTILSQEYPVESTAADEYGRTVGVANVDLPNGAYDGTVVVDETHAIDFLLQSS